jgi:hypothetical protein
MKRKLRIIFELIIIGLLLSGCADGCGGDIQKVTVINNSQWAVKAQIFSENNQSEGWTVISPMNEGNFEVTGGMYTAKVQIINDWLTSALAERERLKNALLEQTPDSEGANEILAALARLSTKIKSYEQTSTPKRCQGIVTFEYGRVRVVDGESANSIKITCVTVGVPGSSE